LQQSLAAKIIEDMRQSANPQKPPAFLGLNTIIPRKLAADFLQMQQTAANPVNWRLSLELAV